MTNISIIIPTLNRAGSLARTLDSVATVVEWDDSVEIIVIDNGSSDDTENIYSVATKKFPKHVWRYYYDDMPGLLSGRHRGARESRGQILAYLDDDVLLAPTWMKALKEGFSNPEIALVGGPSLPKYEVDPPSWLNVLWSEVEGGRSCSYLSLAVLGGESRPTDPVSVWGLNFSLRKSVFYECGGFHPDCIPKALQRYQGDGETGLSLEIQRKGFLAQYHPGFAVTHVISAARLTPEYFEQRAFYSGVCTSYTRIRREGAVPLDVGKSWRDVLRPIKRSLRRALLGQGESEAVGDLIRRAYKRGVRFHQNECRNDPKLLEWILKRDYFDYALPDDWNRYVNDFK